jgi:hypothetical protein
MKFGRYAFYQVFTYGLFALTLTSFHYVDNPAIIVLSPTLLIVFSIYATKEINKINSKPEEYLMSDIKPYLNNLSYFSDYNSLIDKEITQYELDFIGGQFFQIKEKLGLKEELIKKDFKKENLIEWFDKNTSSIHLHDDQIVKEDKISLGQAKVIPLILTAIEKDNFRRALDELSTFIRKKNNKTLSNIERQALGKLFDFYIKKAKEFKYERNNK